jgi:hypothetical protein
MQNTMKPLVSKSNSHTKQKVATCRQCLGCGPRPKSWSCNNVGTSTCEGCHCAPTHVVVVHGLQAISGSRRLCGYLGGRKRSVGVGPRGTGNNTIIWSNNFSAACPRPGFHPAITHLPHPYMHPSVGGTPNPSRTMIVCRIRTPCS